MRLEHKVAVVTGAGRGIGRAVALGFAREGASVILAARTESQVRQVAQEVERLGQRALAMVCDVSQEDQVKAMTTAGLREFGRVDVLVNNAGVGNIRPVWAIPRSAFERVLAVNLVGTFLCTKHLWRSMVEAGGGSIINISSQGGLRGYPLLSAYCASKWGQIGFTLACAEEGKPHAIRVNALAPGKADTAFRAQINEDKERMLKPEDHVGACVFLASDDSRYVTGHVLPLDWFGPQGAAQ
ncbi:MAG: hypothetical protein A2Y93_02335 [Chloroflexi bacterium RBG_13_68_17]|nr:MAG: hypothetical protein A2Y93_02335 [Chloroflexi bacterium RBG_13_68_17]